MHFYNRQNRYYGCKCKNLGMTNPLLIVFKRIFCNHDDTFSFRRYNDFDFFEYCKCANCEKTLRYLRGFDESIRG